MSEHHSCPHCGYNFKADETVERDGWWINPRGRVYYEGREVRFTTQQRLLLHTIAASDVAVAREALGNRLGTESNNSVAVVLSNVRRKVREAGSSVKLHSLWGTGVEWLSA